MALSRNKVGMPPNLSAPKKQNSVGNLVAAAESLLPTATARKDRTTNDKTAGGRIAAGRTTNGWITNNIVGSRTKDRRPTFGGMAVSGITTSGTLVAD